MITISTGGRGDFGHVLSFWKEATTVPSSTDDVAALERLLADSPDALLIALDDGALVGTVIAAWDGWRASMYRLAVAPSHRRQGIATALVADAEARLRAHGARRFHLIVEGGELSAQAFWQSVGFAPTAQLRFVKTVTMAGML